MHTLPVVKHLVNTGYAHCQHQKKEAAEHYGDELYAGHENLCGREGTRPVIMT